MDSSVTRLPARSRITEPWGSRTSKPGMAGVVMTVCLRVGEGKRTLLAVSRRVIQIG